MKKRYLILTFILSLLCVDKAYAYCTQQVKDEFKKIENEYKVTTEYISENKTYTMKIKMSKNHKFAIGFLGLNADKCQGVDETTLECLNLTPGDSFFIQIYTSTEGCNEVLKEEFIELKEPNKYHGDPLCKGNEEFALCQEFYDKEIDREEFEDRVEIYEEQKQEKLEEEQKQQEEQKEDVIEKTTTYLKENLIQIIIIIVFIILVIISSIIGIKHYKQSRRLE